jgi:hypothetical protein
VTLVRRRMHVRRRKRMHVRRRYDVLVSGGR